jgi:hypothetical protein
LAFFIGGLALCVKAYKSKKSLWFNAALIFLAGICLAAASLIRILYFLPFVLLFVIWLIRLVLTDLTTRGKVILIISMIIGSSIIFAPQAVSNKIHYDVYSILPQSQIHKTHIAFLQLYEGLTTQIFESTIENDEAVAFQIPDQQGLIIQKKYFGENVTFENCLNLALHQPFDMAAIYVRHVFNGLDVIYPMPYINNLLSNHIVYRFVNYTLWFLTIILMWRHGIDVKRDAKKLVFTFLIILPALISIPVMIEPRFFLPAYVLMYGYISFGFISRREEWKQLFTLRTAILYVAFLAACFAFSSYVYSTVGVLLSN